MTSNKPTPLPGRVAPCALAPGIPWRAEVQAILPTGRIMVRPVDGEPFECDWLDTGSLRPHLSEGDTVLVMADSTEQAVVLGRVTNYSLAPIPDALELRAKQSLSLQCGEAAVELRADGKVLIRGDDVLIRAKGTKRIRAGTVSIN